MITYHHILTTIGVFGCVAMVVGAMKYVFTFFGE